MADYELLADLWVQRDETFHKGDVIDLTEDEAKAMLAGPRPSVKKVTTEKPSSKVSPSAKQTQEPEPTSKSSGSTTEKSKSKS